MKRNLLIPFISSCLLLMATSHVFSQVGINTDGSQPDPSAGLDVKFSNKGFLPPRVALTGSNVDGPILSPAIGLLVYNTATAGQFPNNVAPGYYYWDGTKWTSLVVPAGTSGQTLRNNGNNWIANSNLYNDGANIGIGTTLSPTHKLTIEGPTQTVRLIGPGEFGSTSKLNFGDADYVYISEDIDDNLLIYGSTRTAIMGGNVGIGTDTPGQRLTVAGTIETTLGGVKFPDGTTQTTAASTHSIGESFGGGIVFYVYDGGRHGLIAATVDQSTAIRWNDGDYQRTNASRDGVYAGQYNTERITIKQGEDVGGSYAAQICANYNGGGYGDWYLPSKYELNLLYLQKAVVGGLALSDYWSSSEWDNGYSWIQNLGAGYQNIFDTAGTFYVRAIRSF